MTRHKAIVLITEGVTPDLLARWGPRLLPSFHRLFAQGASGTMRSEFVPYEPSGLFTAFTGVEPSHHGCFSYWAVHSPDYTPVVLDGTAARRPFLWHRAELADRTVAVLNTFGTHPVRPVNGYCVSYPMRSTLHACHPRDLPIRLARHGIHPVHDVAVWFSGQAKEEWVGEVLNADRQRVATAMHLLDGGEGTPPDLTILNLTSPDRLSHIYWQEIEPGSGVAGDDLAILRAYRLADQTLGRLLDRVDDHTSVLAFSEIGFGPLRSYCSLNDVLEAAGLLVVGPDGRPDWTRTVAFEAVQGTHGININMSGRYKEGLVRPGDYAAVRAEARAALLGHINPMTGLPLVADAVVREELHTGPLAEEAPDLIVVPHDWRYLPLGDQFWSARVHRRWQSGWHRDRSYWGGLGPAFPAGAGGTGRLIDVAPTVMRMLDLPALDDLSGMPLSAIGDRCVAA